jgi:hypothetical protein
LVLEKKLKKGVTEVRYSNGLLAVTHKGKLSDPFPTRSGVKQGCLLSPLLFIISPG